MKEKILTLMNKNTKRLYKRGDVAKILRIEDKDSLKKAIQELEDEGKIYKIRGQRYSLVDKERFVTGILRTKQNGFGFVMPISQSKQEEDIFIKKTDISSAIDGDTVLVRLKKPRKKGASGEIIKILKRGRKEIIGRFGTSRNKPYLIPRNKDINRRVFLENLDDSYPEEGEWIVAEIRDYTQSQIPMVGKLKEVIGKDEQKGIDVFVILKDYNIEPEFPESVVKESKAVSKNISDTKNRTDLRKLRTITIDPVAAKDFDDAISIEKLGNGNYQLWVHIADVSHFVKEDSELDKEAFKRGTSIYPVDRVVPMLPEELSNNACSLNPNVDRLAVSTSIEIDDKGEVIDYHFYDSIINSYYRLNYNEVEEIIENNNSKLIAKYRDVVEELNKMYELSRRLLEKRERDGSLNMDIPETEVELDENLHPVNIKRRERLNSHRLIETFMLLCNEVVATHLYHLPAPTIYRNHEKPDAMKIKELADFLNSIGIRVNPKHLHYSQKLQEVLRDSYKHPDHYIIQKKVLRSMKKAEYGAKNKGHFGLASPCYLHFTSPIRRYPDLIVHRILKKIIEKGHLSSENIDELNATLPSIAKNCSLQERLAEKIEREAVTLKALEFMQQFIGETFKGIISSVEPFGFFVELLMYPVEGLVRVDEINDDYYVHEEKKHRFIGKRTRKVFSLGQQVVVQITNIDIDNLEMDIRLVKTKKDRNRQKGKGKEAYHK